MKKLGLLEVLEGIEDTRREQSVWYPLHEVLFIMLAAVICGATSYVKVEMFGKSRGKWLNMQFREDENSARTDNSAENLNVLRHWAFNRHGVKFCVSDIRQSQGWRWGTEQRGG